MNEEQVRLIIRQELENFLGSDRYTFQKDIEIFDFRNIILGKGVGTMLGTEGYDDPNNGQKLGFWGHTPVIQPLDVPYATGGSTIDAIARDRIALIIDRLRICGIIRTE